MDPIAKSASAVIGGQSTFLTARPMAVDNSIRRKTAPLTPGAWRLYGAEVGTVYFATLECDANGNNPDGTTQSPPASLGPGTSSGATPGFMDDNLTQNGDMFVKQDQGDLPFEVITVDQEKFLNLYCKSPDGIGVCPLIGPYQVSE